MKEVVEALVKRANGSRTMARSYIEQAKQMKLDAQRLEGDAEKMIAEANELDRVRALVYGDKAW